ncbi:hypothetical protein JAAARDRAFT_54556 [Jaapia argillacea MUCL 33604]|uniref:Peptidase A1 domain-containing protein n=1 Tax=Jaapia argillacea MUCL 33604 TaxID=933084 RepID=A0A067Q6N6_9AGAM|nr:hypothetical protein JAAARDRAFT_54556 [Jaapia argillacea MUCL 33604]
MRSLIQLCLFFLALDRVHSIKFPFHVRSTTGFSRHHTNGHGRRATINGTTTANPGTVPIANTHNAEYITNITLNGVSVPVMLDTGSSDLWVAENIPNAKDTGKAAKLSYAVGQANGDIWTAQLTFDDYTVNDQAFLMVTNTSSFSMDITAQGFNGLVGLGPNTGSVIRDKMDSSAGDSMINRIFSQNASTSNFISFILDRQGDPTQPYTGQLTVSEVVPGLENITSMTKISVEKVHKLTDVDQHWQILTDVNGVIGPDGNPIVIKSIAPAAPSGQLVAVLDSGYTLPQVPRAMSDAIYGRVQGAVYDVNSGVWTIPCDQLINISFVFGGVTYPIHPLDTSSSDFGMTDASGNPVCVGAFQPITSAFSLLGEYDMILGMAFLRNTYTLLNYGDFIESSTTSNADPYVQLLSMTDPTVAHADFVKVRMGGVDTSGDAAHALLPPSEAKTSPETAEEKKQEMQEKILSRWPYIFVGCLAFVIICVGLCVWRCCCRRKKGAAGGKGEKGGLEEGMLGLSGRKRDSYRPLEDSSPSMHGHNVSMQNLSLSGGEHGEYQQSYSVRY